MILADERNPLSFTLFVLFTFFKHLYHVITEIREKRKRKLIEKKINVITF